MIEILFRGKEMEFGRWIYGSVLYPKFPDYGVSIRIFDKETDRYEYVYQYIYSNTLGQYTGVNDKTGEKIFEGDIVKVYDKQDGLDKKYKHFIGVIEREKNCFVIVEDKYTHIRNWENFEIEIIGNIFENPELLKNNC